MTGLEICLVIIGLIFVLCSFLFSEHLSAGDAKEDMRNAVNVASVTEEIVKRQVEAEVANIIDDKLDAMEVKAERLTSEKIMAMGEFSDDIQKRISENHEEVMFLYNMLNDKEDVLKNTIRDIEAVKASVKKMASANESAHDVTENKASNDIESETKKMEIGEQAELLKAATVESLEPAVEKKEEFAVKNELQQENNDNREQETRKGEMNKNQKILELRSQGKTNIEIAKELGLGVGEVSLVIDLFNSR